MKQPTVWLLVALLIAFAASKFSERPPRPDVPTGASD
jgi:hypothetical protein